ncbi:MAG TPA: enoyl-CoA hydratase/isomerase family protein [Micropepsaceae bacterium]|nr:enoyl-CoA hydratase/isomerase family protein [Micropepsaceae bacterium]
MTGRVTYSKSGTTGFVLFDRPEARNAMTWGMYEQLGAACRAISADRDVRVAVFRGAGGSFAAGTDIAQFLEFTGGESGIAYERQIEASIELIEKVAKPVIALVEGNCVGGGLVIAAACDLRIATPNARFGVPIARTLGNCLSPRNVSRLLSHFGPARTKRMLLLAELISAKEAESCGFVVRIVESSELEAVARELCTRIAAQAPITMMAAKEMIRRIGTAVAPDCDDLIRTVYGSSDFHEGVQAFVTKRPPNWRGE